MSVLFNTNEFERSHNKSPRGRGSWAFVDYVYAKRNDYLDFVFWSNGTTYQEAKKAAREHFASLGDKFSGEVVVLP